MTFSITPEEALPCAERLIDHLRSEGGSLSVEQAAWSDSPYRTTIVRKLSDSTILYEVQGRLSFHSRLENFAQWLAAHRHSAELHLVAEADAVATAQLFGQLRRYGVGLMLLRDDGIVEHALPARNPARQVNLDSNLRLGPYKHEVIGCFEKFNNGGRKDGFRDLCEIVERETEAVLMKATEKRRISLTKTNIQAKDWADQINALGSSNIATQGNVSLIDAKLKDDLHSFRGARNLVGHKTRSKREEERRQRQFAERMLMGARLVSELTEIRRRIR